MIKKFIRKKNRLPCKEVYHSNNAFFVTICVKERRNIFGNVATVMDNQKNTSKNENESTKNVATVTDGHVHKNGYKNDSNTNPQWRSVIASTENLLQNYKTIWQKSFHDRVIRNDKELTVYQEYVLNNPIRWQLDLLNPINNDKFQQWIKKNRKTKESFD